MPTVNRRFRRMIGKIETGTLNVFQLAIGFLFIFFAFNSQGFIEQTVIDTKSKHGDINKHAGYISLAIIYAVFTFANFIAAPLVNFFGAKIGLIFGGITYGLFQCGFLFLNAPYLYFSAALIGIGAAVIWTAQGKYIAMNSNEDNAAKHSNLFWAVSQFCLTLGGVFLYCMFRDLKKDEKISDSKIKTVYGTFTGVTAVGVAIFCLLRLVKKEEPLTESESDITNTTNTEVTPSISHLLIAPFKLFITKRMIFASMAFAYTGIELAFWSGIYPTCISFTKQLGENTKTLIAFNAIAQGLGQFTAGLLFGILGSYTKKLGRIPIVVLGACLHVVVFIFVYLNFPSEAPLKETEEVGVFKNPSVALAIACGYFLAFGDACWNTQIFSFLVEKYNKQSAEAFALFKFFQSLTTAIAFVYGTWLKLEAHLIILVVTGIIGVVCFIIAELIPTLPEEVEAENNHID